MKPITTYTALLALGFALTAWHFTQGTDLVAYTVLGCGTLALLALQGATSFIRPFWADGTEIPQPTTGHILTTTILVEAATIGIAATVGPIPAAIVRAVGLVIQLAAIGKLGRDFNGADEIDHLAGAAQDKTIQRKHRTP